MKVIKGSVTAPKSFAAAGVHSGIKKKRKDLALIFSKVPAVAAAVFTTNKVKAAPVLVDKQIIKKGGPVQAVVANSGSANACTGRQGIKDAVETMKFTAALLGIPQDNVFVASTGKIGMPLPLDRIKYGVKLAASIMNESYASGTDAATAIMTTDLARKEIAVETTVSGKKIRIGGIVKGSGMIHPGMATMLCFITSDAVIERRALSSALKQSVGSSFNMITVDGDRSTNDTVLVLANGRAGNKKITSGSPGYGTFCQALEYVCLRLAKAIVKDGEGATKFIEIKIKGAASLSDAKKTAFSIATSCLFKTAMYGSDPNWGRIVSAVGNAPVSMDPEKLKVYINGILVVKNNAPVPGSREKARELLTGKNAVIEVDMQTGKSGCVIWTSDLSTRYVRINAAYN